MGNWISSVPGFVPRVTSGLEVVFLDLVGALSFGSNMIYSGYVLRAHTS